MKEKTEKNVFYADMSLPNEAMNKILTETPWLLSKSGRLSLTTS